MEPSAKASSSQVKLDTIPLYIIGGKATVWDPQTAATLHCIHNISGLRVGTLPGVTQQNGFLGLPITLMPEETAYLVSQAHLVPVSTMPKAPSADEIQRRTEARLMRVRKVEAALRAQEEANKMRAKEKFEKGGEKAKAKREARAKAKEEKAKAKALAEGLELEEDAPPPTAIPPPSPPVQAPVPTPGTESLDDVGITGNHFHAVASHPLFPHLAYEPPITSVPHPLFPFPETPRDRALVATFTDLLKRGLRIGLGPRFGGEYLVYPGDYLRYHAHFTSQVLVRDEPLKPTEIVAWGRLGTGTKKAGLICCWDDGRDKSTKAEESGTDEQEEMEYYSLEWASFG